MMHYPLLRTSIRPQHTAPTITPSPALPRVLNSHHHVLFAQRLAVLIKRMRAATKEGTANDR